jgi:hypothetical protein
MLRRRDGLAGINGAQNADVKEQPRAFLLHSTLDGNGTFRPMTTSASMAVIECKADLDDGTEKRAIDPLRSWSSLNEAQFQ